MINSILDVPFVPKHIKQDNTAEQLQAEAQGVLSHAHNSAGQGERDHHIQSKG